jgi:acyl-coenzyme A thioesterase PaaI-like protein
MLMTFADMALAIGAIFELDLDRFLPTVNLTGDFLAPAPFGAWVEGRTEVLRTTRNLIFAHCVVTADSVPVLRTSGILKIGPAMKDRLDLRALLG